LLVEIYVQQTAFHGTASFGLDPYVHVFLTLVPAEKAENLRSTGALDGISEGFPPQLLY